MAYRRSYRGRFPARPRMKTYDPKECLNFQAVTASGTQKEEEIILPVSLIENTSKGVAVKLSQIRIEVPAAVDGKISRISITTQSKGTTEPELDDSNVIEKWHELHEILGTNGGRNTQILIKNYYITPAALITVPKIYFQFYQDSGSAHTYRCKMYYELVESDLIAMTQNLYAKQLSA